MGRITFLDEIASGDQRRALEVLRDHLAVALDQAEERYVASLARELQAVLKQLAGMPVEKKVTIEDELARRRQEDGQPDAEVPDRSTVPVKRKGAQRRRTGT
jgi:hypothetical protein